MSTRNTVQSLSATRGSATVTIAVDYGASPPRVTVQCHLRSAAGDVTPCHRHEILPAGDGLPARWDSDGGQDEESGRIPFGTAVWRDASNAELAAFEFAKRRWRVVYRRLAGIAQSNGAPYRTDRNGAPIETARKP